jgi:hypothetical protein
MKIRFSFKVNGKPVSALEAANDLMHPDKFIEQTLQQKIAGLSCDTHPIQCRKLTLKVSNGKVQLQNVCCDAFRQTVLRALQSQDSAEAERP